MEINFNKYRPILLKTEVNKLNKFSDYKYFITKDKFQEILIEIPKKDIDIEKLKYFLFNLGYLENEEEISSWIYKVKVKNSNKKIEDLEYCYYYLYLKYYKNKNMDNIYNSITKLGKATFKYMSFPKEGDNFIISFQKIFHQGKNTSFFNFLYEELKKRLTLEKFNFFEEYFINYNSELGRDLILKYLNENTQEKVKDKKIEANLQFLKDIIKK